VHEKDWAKYRFALIQEATFKQPTHISDGELILGPNCGSSLSIAFAEDILYDHKWLAEDVLGLDHMDKAASNLAVLRWTFPTIRCVRHVINNNKPTIH